MNLRTLTHSRTAILAAGVLVGALATILPAASSRQSQDDTPPRRDIVAQPLAMPAFGTSDSNGAMIAVTGIDVTGSSILYLIDTKGRHIAVYQANGGSESTQGLKLVGARRIDLDLELEGYFDKSEYPYRDLQKKFSEISRDPRPPK
jgi:hypothetical protein